MKNKELKLTFDELFESKDKESRNAYELGETLKKMIGSFEVCKAYILSHEDYQYDESEYALDEMFNQLINYNLFLNVEKKISLMALVRCSNEFNRASFYMFEAKIHLENEDNNFTLFGNYFKAKSRNSFIIEKYAELLNETKEK